ncbi:MAG: hypothetical protein J6R42_05320 [Clostridia bacterium]|nr:hypothetical protein [Clostridia bacterium]
MKTAKCIAMSLCHSIPRSEHPRPQFFRASWENLNSKKTGMREGDIPLLKWISRFF